MPGIHANHDAVLSGLDVLRLVGEGLNRGLDPVVHDGGAVGPGAPHLTTSVPAKESKSAGQGSGGSPTGSGEGTSRGPRPSDGSATQTGSAAPLLGNRGQVGSVEGEMSGVAEAYPQREIRSTPGITWIFNRIQPIQGLRDAALVVTASPKDPWRRVVSWAWWDPEIWIGPRHTNYPDGSICSFEPSDGTWRRGDSLVGLLDLHTVWVVRQMFLRHFGRWPGRQSLHTAYERVTEHEPGELCGCDSGLLYESCCRVPDLRQSPARRWIEFQKKFGSGHRSPPGSVVTWLFAGGAAPSIEDVSH